MGVIKYKNSNSSTFLQVLGCEEGEMGFANTCLGTLIMVLFTMGHFIQYIRSDL